MQTFLPYANLEKTASCLDDKRLGKQRIEAKQIYEALTDPTSKSYRFRNHPAVKMWKGYEMFLLMYGIAICQEWIDRGFKDNQLNWFLQKLFNGKNQAFTDLPKWWKNKKFHVSHRSNLVRKKPEHYSKFEWNVPDNLEYVWPTN